MVSQRRHWLQCVDHLTIFPEFLLHSSLCPFEDHSSSSRKLAIPNSFGQRSYKLWSWLILAAFLQFLHILSYPIFRKVMPFFFRELQTVFNQPCFFSFAFWKLPLIRSFNRMRCFSVVTFRPCLHIRWFRGLALVIAIFIELNVEDSLTTMGRTLVLG